jgi:hypothetical protein
VAGQGGWGGDAGRYRAPKLKGAPGHRGSEVAWETARDASAPVLPHHDSATTVWRAIAAAGREAGRVEHASPKLGAPYISRRATPHNAAMSEVRTPEVGAV